MRLWRLPIKYNRLFLTLAMVGKSVIASACDKLINEIVSRDRSDRYEVMWLVRGLQDENIVSGQNSFKAREAKPSQLSFRVSKGLNKLMIGRTKR